jgi:branched-chain amino acid transport system permease protein
MNFRLRHLILLVVACGSVLFGLSAVGTAHAQDGEQVKVRVQFTPSEAGAKKQPIEGVTVEALDASGAVVATDATDAKGIAELTVPTDGVFTIRLDATTLPEGIGLPEGDAGTRDVSVTAGLGGNANFNLGKAASKPASKLSTLPRTIVNGIRFGLVIAIMSVGLSLIYGTTGLSNFAHAETVTLGAVVAWTIDTKFRLVDATSGAGAAVQLAFAALAGIAAGAGFSALLETRVWRPMRKRRIGLTSMMIVSIGLAILVRFTIQFRFGAQPKSYPEFSSQTNVKFGPVEATPRDLMAAGLSIICLVGVAYMLMRTRVGKAIRAVSDNPDLSSSTGINTDRIILFVWVVGGALAGLSGVLFGLDEQVQWNMGSRLLLLMFAAITLGGLGRPFGALVGSLVVGIFVQLWAWAFGGFTDLKNVGALAALILILVVRPQGILGKQERIG